MFSHGSFTVDMMSPYLTLSKSPPESLPSASEDGGYPSTDGIHLVGWLCTIDAEVSYFVVCLIYLVVYHLWGTTIFHSILKKFGCVPSMGDYHIS